METKQNKNKIERIKKIMIRKYSNDPLYLAVLEAKSQEECSDESTFD